MASVTFDPKKRAFTAKAKGQDENVDPPFLEVADKVVHGDLGHQDEVPEPHRGVERHDGSWKNPSLLQLPTTAQLSLKYPRPAL